MKSIAQQNVTQLGGPGSVLVRQKRDHAELGRLLRKLSATQPERAGTLLVRIWRLVFPHAFAEETVLWPVIRRVVPDGHEITLRNEREHQQINALVTRLEQLPRGSPEWRQVLQQVVETLGEDVRDEENLLLPALQQKLSMAELQRLGMLWEAVRRIAPTRPHPVVSRRPPGNVLAALPLTIVDRARDRVDLWRYRRGNGRAAQLLGSGLTQTAHAVEHGPGLQSGEDPATKDAAARSRGWKLAGAAAIVGVVLLVRRARLPLPAQ